MLVVAQQLKVLLVVQVRVRQILSVKVPDNLGADIDAAASDGWQIDQVVPIMAKGLLGGSYTDSLLVFLMREQRGGS